MLNVAITGSLAAGKSQMLKYVASLGYPVLNCDDEVKKIMMLSDVTQELRVHFNCVVNDKVDRKLLSFIVFNDPEKLALLENIIYKYLRGKIDAFMLEDVGQDIKFIEIPLLFEKNQMNRYDKIVCIHADNSIRHTRFVARGGEVGYFDKIEKLHIDPNLKIKQSHFVILNNADEKSFYHNIDAVLSMLCKIV